MTSDMFENAPTDPTRVAIEPPTERWPTILAEFVDVLLMTFKAKGLAEDEAMNYAQEGVMALGQHMGGRNTYLPTGERLANGLRDRRIYLEYNGRNKHLLAERYNLTERRIEQIAVEQRAVHVRKIQPRLFD